MIITYEGAEFVKIQYGNIVIACNPISKNSKLKGGRFGADIVLVTANNPDFNGIDSVTFGEKEPFAITGPGEYELGGILIRGFPSKTSYGGLSIQNTIYVIDIEGMSVCFMGALDEKELSKEFKESLLNLDILFMPIGGDGVLSPADAYSLAVSLEPKIIIPIHYGSVGNKNALSTFLKEGSEESKAIDKLTVKKKDLEAKNGDIVVLKATN